MSKLTKEDIKSPDKMTQALQTGFKWTAGHLKGVIVVSVVLIAAGGGYAVYTSLQHKKEAQFQEQFYLAEKEYLTAKENFNKVPPPTADKNAKKTTEAAATAKPSGDLEKDYGTAVKSFEETLSKAPASRAGMMAALHLADLYTQYGKKDQALQALQKVELCSDLLSALVSNRMAGLQADLNQCDQAIQTWEQVAKNKSATFLTPEVRLKQALCYETKNDKAKAEEFYKKAKEISPESMTAKTADKYLQILRSKVE